MNLFMILSLNHVGKMINDTLNFYICTFAYPFKFGDFSQILGKNVYFRRQYFNYGRKA